MDDLLPLTDIDFRFIADMLYERFGIHLEDQKRILVAGRLNKRVRTLGLASFSEYFKFLRADKSGDELSELINRITTNHSFFFRERDHFDFIGQTVLPELDKKIKANPKYPLRIWSAGCAAGEEVHTLAMVLREHFGPAIDSLDIGLIATDISLAALNEAKEGSYPENRLKEVPKALLHKYFIKNPDGDYSVTPDIKKMVLFKRLNLMTEKFPFQGNFDIVFCRNVMIYFDNDSRRKLVSSVYNCIKPGGFFFIGHSESLQRDTCPFNYVRPAIYRKGASEK